MSAAATAPERARSRVDLTSLDSLPLLEMSRQDVLAVLGDDSPPEQLAAAVEAAPMLAVALLRFANRTAPRSVGSIGAAVERVPRATLAALVRSLPQAGVLGGSPWGTVPAHFRQHALAVRSVTARLVRDLGQVDADEHATLALVHDIGKLALHRSVPGYPDAVHNGAHAPEARVAAERSRLGVDHASLGGQLARRWRFPEHLAVAIETHHSALEGPAATVRAADLLTHFANGLPIDVEELARVGDACGLRRDALSRLIYELPEPLLASQRSSGESPLSDREVEVLRLLVGGMTTKQAAMTLGLSVSTVNNHLHRIYRRLGASGRAQALLIATREGWV